MKINWSFIEPVRDQATRLRGDYPAQSAIVKLAEQQADIERLREENVRLRNDLKNAIFSDIAYTKEIERQDVLLREENARLWDLLDNALGWLDDKEHDKPLMSLDSIRAARAAILEGGKDD